MAFDLIHALPVEYGSSQRDHAVYVIGQQSLNGADFHRASVAKPAGETNKERAIQIKERETQTKRQRNKQETINKQTETTF